MAVSRRAALGFVGAATLAPRASAQRQLRVAASFSILADLVRQIGQDHVAVATLVDVDGDVHVYEPTPADARELASADLVVVNGLGFEGWLDRLVRASGYRGPIVTASEHIRPRSLAENHEEAYRSEAQHAHGALDPHAWQDVRNGIAYATRIGAALEALDPSRAASYRPAADAYVQRLAALDEEIRSMLGGLPAERRRIITSHDAFGYFGQAYGLELLAAAGLSSDTEPSPADVARLIRQIRDERVPAVFLESIADPRLIEQIAREARVTIGGTPYSDALSPPGGPAATYPDMMRHNARTIAAAIAV